MLDPNVTIAVIGTIIVIGILAQWFARKTGVSTALLLMLLGILFGPVLNLFDPLEFEGLIHAVVTFALIIVIFDAGYVMKFGSLKKTLPKITSFAALAVLVTVILSSLIGYFLLDLSWQLSVLLGALVASTDITIILPLMKNLNLGPKLENTLNVEATINSPFAAITATVIAVVLTTKTYIGEELAFAGHTFLYQVFVGIGLGVVLGMILLNVFKKLQLEIMPQILNIGTILLVYAVAQLVGASGIFAVFTTGIIFGNFYMPFKRIIREFETTVSLLITIFVFVIFGTLLKPSIFLGIGLFGLIFIIVAILSRAIAVYGYTRSWLPAEQKYLFMIAPRGMVCAVLALSFMNLFPDPNLVLGIVFSLMIITIIFASIAKYVAGKPPRIKLGKQKKKVKARRKRRRKKKR